MERIIITMSRGMAEVEGNPSADITIIDLDPDTEVDYDTAQYWCMEVLQSDLSGPEQFHLVGQITKRFLAWAEQAEAEE